MSLQRVLVGVDGGAASIGAARAAVELVAPDGLIQLVRVVETSGVRRVIDWTLSGGLPDAVQARRQGTAEASLTQLADVLRAQTTAEVEVVVGGGQPAEELLQVAADGAHELIVIGDARPRSLRKQLLGGLARPLVERSRAPVLVVPEGVLVHRVRGALVLAAEHPAPGELRDASRVLGRLRPELEFAAVRPGKYADVGVDLQTRTSRSLVIVPRRTALETLGTEWILDHAACAVLFVTRRAPGDEAAGDGAADEAASDESTTRGGWLRGASGRSVSVGTEGRRS